MRHSPVRPEIQIPGPTRTVEKAASLLAPQSTVLDMGAGTGRNGHYLSRFGHRVFSIERDRSQIIEGRKIARSLGRSVLTHTFIEADMRTVDINDRYDAVITTYSLQDLQREEALETLERMRRLVKPGGLNVLDAYIASAEQQYEKPGYTLFDEGELKRLYEDAGWEILHYETTGIKPSAILWDSRNRINKAWLESQEGLIARETKNAAIQRQLRARAAYVKNTDPEHAEELLRQADII